MTKTSKKAKTELPPAPAGFNLLLSVFDDSVDFATVYARARQIVDDRETFRDGHLKAIRAADSIEAVFPGFGPVTGSEPCVASVVKAGVILGAAAAWVIMTDLNGGAR